MLENSMWLNAVAAIVAAFAVGVSATPVVRHFALRWRLGDKPNGRKIHTHLIPHLGGIALVLGTVAAVVASSLLPGADRASWMALAGKMVPAVLLIVLLGLVDDTKNLRAIQKLTIQILAAVVLTIAGFSVFTGLPVIDGWQAMVTVVTVLFLVGMSSAVNLIDGHDGLAAGTSAISAATFAVVATMMGNTMLLVISMGLVGACLGFLVFNFPPGKIYMGDNGSMFLGIMLALIACSISMLEPTAGVFIGVCLILGVPMLDAILAIARRAASRAPVFRADSLHMHHVLKQAGFTPRQTLAVLYTMQGLFALLGVGAMTGLVMPVIVGVMFVIVAFASFLRMMIASRPSGGRAQANIAPDSIPLKRNLQSNVPARRSVGR